MATIEYKKHCELCGLLVEIEGFSLLTEKGMKWFCCAGCQSIYQLIFLTNRPMDIDESKTTNNEDN